MFFHFRGCTCIFLHNPECQKTLAKISSLYLQLVVKPCLLILKLINAQRLKYLKASTKSHPEEVVGFIYGVMTSSVDCEFCLNRNT